MIKNLRNLLAMMAVTVIATHPFFGIVRTPEIDPGTGMTALALIGGSILVIRGRVKP